MPFKAFEGLWVLQSTVNLFVFRILCIRDVDSYELGLQIVTLGL